MKRIVLSVCLLGALLCGNAQGGGTSIDGIVAVIGKSIIMRSDLEKHYNDYTAQSKGSLVLLHFLS